MSRAAKAQWRATRTKYIENFIEDTGYDIHWFEPWHCRIDGSVDLYPTNGRYFVIETEMWGEWHTEQDIYKIFQDHKL